MGARPCRLNVSDLIDGSGSIVLNAPLDGRGVLQGQLAFVGVVAATFGPQDQEPLEPGHVIHGVGVAAGAVGDLPLVQRLGLRGRGQPGITVVAPPPCWRSNVFAIRRECA